MEGYMGGTEEQREWVQAFLQRTLAQARPGDFADDVHEALAMLRQRDPAWEPPCLFRQGSEEGPRRVVCRELEFQT